ncbi:hypothetical protein [Pseudonocardia hydrocarbonoxydans]|uniref:hypothetical protein n=1 Tax=Pseudonocardia hydrocarbonoxydans TaxID=76726 RepID=UPI0031D17E10
MSAPDYPLLALGSYETYQLAHIATFIAERLARHRHSAKGREGRAARAEAVRDIAGAATALDNATGTTTTGSSLPRPLDRETFSAARELLTNGQRTADVVSLAAMGEAGWAVVGHVPGVGAVGARVDTERLAEALRSHFMTRPAGELAVWAVSEQPQRMPTLPRRVDLAAFVEQLEPSSADDRAVARNLRGQDRRVDAAIRGRFAGVDLDAPAVVNPPDRSLQPSRATPPGAAVSRTATRSAARLRLHRPTAALRVPSTRAGP